MSTASLAASSSPSSPWLNSLDGAIEYRHLAKDGSPSREAFLAWAKRHGLIPVYRGRTPLYARADVDATLNKSVVDAARSRRAAHVVAMSPVTHAGEHRIARPARRDGVHPAHKSERMGEAR